GVSLFYFAVVEWMSLLSFPRFDPRWERLLTCELTAQVSGTHR
ncbi:MAG: hypothetical protein JWO75_1643, partial [Actinomycetia bacterium]|nr:hypothetical protein [Actinomycetes bacterium]